jgi:hypothetical protein
VQSAFVQQLAVGMHVPPQGLYPASHWYTQPPLLHAPEVWLAGSFGQSALVQQFADGMHTAPQGLNPALQLSMQVPPGAEHAFEPFVTLGQLLGLLQHVPLTMQVPAQSLVPPGHEQDPPAPEHTLPPVQLLLSQQLPLVIQVPPQSYVPPGQEQEPPTPEQTLPPAQLPLLQQVPLAMQVPPQS